MSFRDCPAAIATFSRFRILVRGDTWFRPEPGAAREER